MKKELNFLTAGKAREYSFKFEFLSFLGRKMNNKKPPTFSDYCNMGSGPRYLEGMVNADIYSFNFLRKIFGKETYKVDWEIDLRYKLNCNDNHFSGILLEHTFEHLSIIDGLNLLSELRRILKKNSILRISVPDLEKYISFYKDKIPHQKFLQWKNKKSEALWSLNHNFGHNSVYDYELLKKLLTIAGFTKIRKGKFQDSEDINLQIDDPGRAWESLYVEAKN